MNRKQRIYIILNQNLSKYSIEVIDNSHKHNGHNNFNGSGETHMQVILSHDSEIKINKIQIHRLINSLLIDEFEKGLHSLEIRIRKV